MSIPVTFRYGQQKMTIDLYYIPQKDDYVQIAEITRHDRKNEQFVHLFWIEQIEWRLDKDPICVEIRLR